MSPIRAEIRKLASLSGPLVASQLLSMMLWTTDLLMVGRLGVEALNAVTLGRLWVMGTFVSGMGLLFGLDPLASQAHGARDRERLGDALVNGCGLALLLSLPLAALWWATEPLLLAFGQDPETVRLARMFVRVQIPALPFFLVFIALRQYLQARGIVRPALWISLGANFVNASANWVLIYGKFGFPRLGVVGSGLATALTQVAMLVALLIIFRRYRLDRGAARRLDLSRLRWHGILSISRLGSPVALQFVLEYWAFALVTLQAGKLGPIELASHAIVLNLASIAYMVPFGISFGAATRVGNLIGAGDPRGAQRAGWVALGFGGGVMLAFALLFVLGRHAIPAWYGAPAEVIVLTAALMPVVAAFELFDGLQAVGGGILRGTGRTRPAALANLIGYYVIAMPLALWLGAPNRMGLVGLWWGLSVGLLAVAGLLVAWIAVRGPATARPIAVTGLERGYRAGTFDTLPPP